MPHGVPDHGGIQTFVLVPINVARCCNGYPIDLLVPVRAVNSWIMSMLSTISWRRCAGFLEGTDGAAEDAIPKEGLEGLPVYHIAGPTEDPVHVEL